MREIDRFRLLATATGSASGAEYGLRRVILGTTLRSRFFLALREHQSGVIAKFFGVCAVMLLSFRFGPIVTIAVVACLLDYHYVLPKVHKKGVAKRLAIEHLVTFLDSISGALAQRRSIEQAFISGVLSTPTGPLKTELERTATLIRQGVALDRALADLHSRVEMHELASANAVLLSFSRIGGNALEGFNRFSRRLRLQNDTMMETHRRLMLIHRMITTGAAVMVVMAAAIRFYAAPWLFEHRGGGAILFEVGIALVLCAIMISRRVVRL